MIKETVAIANEYSLLKKINDRNARKEKNLEDNRKHYWELSASQRLHYDSAVGSTRSHSLNPFPFTLSLVKVYFYALVVFTLFKVLFQVDPIYIVDGFLAIVGTMKFSFPFMVLMEVIGIVIDERRKKRTMDYLNENYGFKKL